MEKHPNWPKAIGKHLFSYCRYCLKTMCLNGVACWRAISSTLALQLAAGFLGGSSSIPHWRTIRKLPHATRSKERKILPTWKTKSSKFPPKEPPKRQEEDLVELLVSRRLPHPRLCVLGGLGRSSKGVSSPGSSIPGTAPSLFLLLRNPRV